MSANVNKEIVQQFVKRIYTPALNDAAIKELVAPDFLGHSGDTITVRGHDGLKKAGERIRSTFPVHSMAIEDILAEGDRVAVRLRFTGMNEGVMRHPLIGNVKPTGKQLSWTAQYIYRVSQGKVTEAWYLHDTLSQFLQLGVTFSAPGDR